MAIYDIFSKEDLDYLHSCKEVIESKELVNSSPMIYFNVPITESIRITLLNKLGLNISINEIPMRWIKGDTLPHIDSGISNFKNTYLVYLTDSSGEFIIENEMYPIIENSAFVFKENTLHRAQNTKNTPRLLLGPMNEFAQQVGGPSIQYYNNYQDAYAQNSNRIAVQGYDYIIGSNIIDGSIGSYTSWRIAYVYGGSIPTGIYKNGFDLTTLGSELYSYYLYPSTPCFLEGSKILCYIDEKDTYIPIESIKPGILVKTSLHGYKKVELIGKGNISNSGNSERSENRLYKCCSSKYPELIEDLYITGCHSILVDNITDVQRKKTINHLGKIFITDKKYRLMACIDERAEPWNSNGYYTIWHIALENKDEKINNGIYANGLLVETCCIQFLKNKSNMIL